MDDNLLFSEFVKNHLHDDVNQLALQAVRYPDVDVRRAIVQIRGRQIAEKKLPRWVQIPGILFPEHLPLEQCSSEQTAQYKVTLLQDLPMKKTMADLTGGFGVDAAVMGCEFSHLFYVEQNPELCQLACHNFPLLGVRSFEVLNARCDECLDLLPHLDFIFIDPARRDENGKKTVSIADCTPDVCELNMQLLAKADRVMVKLSPMLDVTTLERELRGLRQIHIVSVGNDCKEMLAVLSGESSTTCEIVCVNILSDTIQRFSFTHEMEQKASCKYVTEVLDYLYEPNASLMKGGCFKLLAKHYAVQKLHPNSHLFTSHDLIPDFPGRIFKVVQTIPFNRQGIRQLSYLKKANLAVRNFPLSVADLRKRLKLSEGGSTYLFATTLANEDKVIVIGERL